MDSAQPERRRSPAPMTGIFEPTGIRDESDVSLEALAGLGQDSAHLAAEEEREEARTVQRLKTRHHPMTRIKDDVAHWLAARTFAPQWLPESWRQPIPGYALAAVLQVGAALATLVAAQLVPTFSFVGLLELFVVALVAVLWGAGPCVFSALLGATLLEWLVLPLGFGKHYAHPVDLVEVGWFLLIGLALGAVAGQTEKARREAEEQRAQAHARELALRELNQRTDEFLSLASHELRSPLTSIKVTLQLTERRLRRLTAQGDIAEPQLAARITPLLDVVGQAQLQVDRQNRLIGDLLDVSRIRANKLEFRFAPVDLASLVRMIVDEQRLAWSGRAITLEGADQAVPVHADADRIGQVLTNLVTNALKYSPPDSPVAVSLEHDEQSRSEGQRCVARVRVRDQGPGLTPEQQRHIWERFHRVSGIRQQSGSGTGLGLGLYIVRSIVERHGGAVGIDSAPGRGSTFSFTLPLARDSVPSVLAWPPDRTASQ
ncbi:MAG TPA: HAMP domain-containing sensor histidine kinase [Ktedonobacterales bacterium]